MNRRKLKCPGNDRGQRCNAAVKLKETRPTSMERVITMRLYQCPEHEFETAETLVGDVRKRGSAPKAIWRHSTRTARRLREAKSEEYVS